MKTGDGMIEASLPGLTDYPVILRGSKGEIRGRDPSALYALACNQGWPDACGKTAELRR
jgi:hypothetical protein